MSYYQITLLVTEEQEDAIIVLFTSRQWKYLKTGDDCDTLPFDNIRTLQAQDSFENIHISQEQRNESSSDNSRAVMKPVDAAYDRYGRHESLSIENPVYGLRTETDSPTGILTDHCNDSSDGKTALLRGLLKKTKRINMENGLRGLLKNTKRGNMENGPDSRKDIRIPSASSASVSQCLHSQINASLDNEEIDSVKQLEVTREVSSDKKPDTTENTSNSNNIGGSVLRRVNSIGDQNAKQKTSEPRSRENSDKSKNDFKLEDAAEHHNDSIENLNNDSSTCFRLTQNTDSSTVVLTNGNGMAETPVVNSKETQQSIRNSKRKNTENGLSIRHDKLQNSDISLGSSAIPDYTINDKLGTEESADGNKVCAVLSKIINPYTNSVFDDCENTSDEKTYHLCFDARDLHRSTNFIKREQTEHFPCIRNSTVPSVNVSPVFDSEINNNSERETKYSFKQQQFEKKSDSTEERWKSNSSMASLFRIVNNIPDPCTAEQNIIRPGTNDNRYTSDFKDTRVVKTDTNINTCRRDKGQEKDTIDSVEADLCTLQDQVKFESMSDEQINEASFDTLHADIRLDDRTYDHNSKNNSLNGSNTRASGGLTESTDSPTNSFTEHCNKASEWKKKLPHVYLEKKLQTLKSTKNIDTPEPKRQNNVTDIANLKRRRKAEKSVKVSKYVNIYCKNCEHTFKIQKAYDEHVKNGRCRHECQFCGKIFLYNTHLHYKSHVDWHKKKSDRANRKAETSVKVSKFANIYCKDCEHTFKFKNRYDEHLKYDRCRHECEFCGKLFLYNKSLDYKRHIKYHKKQRDQECKICGKLFIERYKLTQHIKLHELPKPMVCEVCGLCFKDTTALNVHKGNMHNDKREKRQCPECPKMFKSQHGLWYHIQTKHNQDNSITFPCSICNKVCKNKLLLKAHMETHRETREFKCDTCNAMFKRAGGLYTHKKRHKGAFVHFCQYCQKGFYDSRALRDHENIHTGARPYLCTFCDYTCASHTNIKKHEKLVHKNKNTSGEQ